MLRGKNLYKDNAGFTIVELLIVVVVIAILAAITIVSYNGITNRARTAAVQSAASQAAKKISSEAILNGDRYPDTIDGLGLTAANGTTYQYTVNNDSSPAGYCVTAVSNGSSSYVAKTFSYNGGTVLNQDTPVAGACPGHSSSGGTVITNLIPNSSFEIGSTGWIASGSLIAASTTSPTSGTGSLRVQNTGTGNTGDARLNGGSPTIMVAGMEPGKTYTATARVTLPAANTGGLGRAPGIMIFYSTNGSTWNESFGPKSPAAAGTYTVSYTFTLPANTTGTLFGLGAASTTANQFVYYDSVMLTEGSTASTYADGYTPGWVWTGAVGNSASRGPAQ